MVLADLGRKLNNALSALNRAPVVDEKVGIALNVCRTMICPDRVLFPGSGRNVEGNHCGTARIRCQRQTRFNTTTKGQSESKSISREYLFGQFERSQQEESCAEGLSPITAFMRC
jgi:hypothetical protein